MKGSKKYMGHEYYKTQAAASGLGKDLGAHKAAAEKTRSGSKTFPEKKGFWGGGTITSGSSNPAPNTHGEGGSGQGLGGNLGPQGAASTQSSMQSAFGTPHKAKGGKIDGKPKYKGDDPRNDVVNIKASKGEVVLPNSVTQSKNAPKKAEKFMKKEMKKKK